MFSQKKEFQKCMTKLYDLSFPKDILKGLTMRSFGNDVKFATVAKKDVNVFFRESDKHFFLALSKLNQIKADTPDVYLDALKALHEEYPDNLFLNNELYVYYLLRSDYLNALAYLENNVCLTSGQNVFLLLKLADLYFTMNDFDNALRYVLFALEIDPTNLHACLLYSKCMANIKSKVDVEVEVEETEDSEVDEEFYDEAKSNQDILHVIKNNVQQTVAQPSSNKKLCLWLKSICQLIEQETHSNSPLSN